MTIDYKKWGTRVEEELFAVFSTMFEDVFPININFYKLHRGGLDVKIVFNVEKCFKMFIKIEKFKVYDISTFSINSLISKAFKAHFNLLQFFYPKTILIEYEMIDENTFRISMTWVRDVLRVSSIYRKVQEELLSLIEFSLISSYDKQDFSFLRCCCPFLLMYMQNNLRKTERYTRKKCRKRKIAVCYVRSDSIEIFMCMNLNATKWDLFWLNSSKKWKIYNLLEFEDFFI
jgi:hypothetical protein